ncbi:MAG: hypothetical protein ACXWLF_06825, partial [Myxococcaceae bacterium]
MTPLGEARPELPDHRCARVGWLLPTRPDAERRDRIVHLDRGCHPLPGARAGRPAPGRTWPGARRSQRG